ncbi:MAG: hypothetical protein CMH48_05525 [Muricauda sp.]|nr:hypothetical protein [Allomuricauda sp.]MBC30286.1 hypothetical protein [Allomuricauda sp.]
MKSTKVLDNMGRCSMYFVTSYCHFDDAKQGEIWIEITHDLRRVQNDKTMGLHIADDHQHGFMSFRT